jgi:sugar (pentulose or hexulose) kinase
MNDPLYLGLDFGTSGARAMVINAHGEIAAQAHCHYDIANWQSWLHALTWLCASLPRSIRQRLAAIAIDGTSSTVLLCDASNVPLLPPLLYNDTSAATTFAQISAHVPAGHIASNASSSLAKLHFLLQQVESKQAHYFSDQASWLAAMLTAKPGFSDYHNALKLGYDLEALAWPAWISALEIAPWLPEVVPPGTVLGEVAPEVSAKLDIPQECVVRAGTTDSIAAFIASGAHAPGMALTSLGSTLVLKLLSTTRVEDARYGIYSHRFGDRWLAGGASNSGGAVLRKYFDDATLVSLSQQIDPEKNSGLDYYPLLNRGERFPIYDPQLAPHLSPRPSDDAQFLHGLLEGIARIEARGYDLLVELGATPVREILTAGGGAKNAVWSLMRERLTGVRVSTPTRSDAAYGAAYLAKNGADLLLLQHD